MGGEEIRRGVEEKGYRGRGEAKCKPRLEGDHGDGGGGCEVVTE